MSKPFEPSPLIIGLLEDVGRREYVDETDAIAVEAELRRQVKNVAIGLVAAVESSVKVAGTAFDISESAQWLSNLARAIAEIEEHKRS